MTPVRNGKGTLFMTDIGTAPTLPYESRPKPNENPVLLNRSPKSETPLITVNISFLHNHMDTRHCRGCYSGHEEEWVFQVPPCTNRSY